MPLTKNAVHHIARQYRRARRLRTSPVTLRYFDGSTRVIRAIWKWTDTADPQFGSATSAGIAKTAQAADAAFEVLLTGPEGISLGELAAVTSVSPTSLDGLPPSGLRSSYLIIEIQPKGTAWPPARAYVLLRKV